MYRVTDLTSLARGGGAGIPPGTTQQRPLTARGKVAIAPTSETGSMQVVVQTTTLVYAVEIPGGNWTPRGAALPAVGDECLIVYDDIGDAFVPVWAGTTKQPVIPGYSSPLQAANQTGVGPQYMVFTSTPTLTGGMQNDTPPYGPNGPKVPLTGWYDIDLYCRIDMGATGGVFIGVQLEVWDPSRSGTVIGSPTVYISHDNTAGLVESVNFATSLSLLAGQYVFFKWGGSATSVLYGTGAWTSGFTVTYKGPAS